MEGVRGERCLRCKTDAKAKPSGLPRAGEALSDSDRDGDTIPAKRSLGGSYDGASGRFECIGNCDISRGGDDVLIVTGTWTFEPTSLTGRVVKQDADWAYLYFGIWAEEPKDAAEAHPFQWIAGGGAETGANLENYTALKGTATFTGGAVGKYALKAAAGREARIGTFTAKATFTADFSANMFDGRISDFQEGGRSFGAGWSVGLIAEEEITSAVLECQWCGVARHTARSVTSHATGNVERRALRHQQRIHGSRE